MAFAMLVLGNAFHLIEAIHLHLTPFLGFYILRLALCNTNMGTIDLTIPTL
jgi:hypothetical protein